MLLVMSLPSNNTAVCSHSGHFMVVLLDFKPRLVWQAASGSDMDYFFFFFLIQHMGISWSLRKTAWGSTGAGNWIESYSVKQGGRRICQSSLESHRHVFPWLISIPFSALSVWNRLIFKGNRKSRSFRLCHSLEWRQAHRVTASGCMWRVFSGKTAWQVPCLLLPLWSRIKRRLVNSDCTAFKIKTSGYKIKKRLIKVSAWLFPCCMRRRIWIFHSVLHITLSFVVFTCRIFHCPF